MFVLEVHDGDAVPRTVSFQTVPVTIGRDASMDVVLPDPMVSRQSAMIILRDGGFVLQDLGGRNAVRVNGAATVSHPLRAGDRIALGRFTVLFRPGDAGAPGEGSASDSGELVLHPSQSLERFLDKEAGGGDSTHVSAGPPSLAADRLVDILLGFSELIQRLPERERLFHAALGPVFDCLDVKRSFIGLFSEDGGLEIVAERNARPGSGESFSRSMIDRVREEGVAILFADPPSGISRQDSRSQVRLRIKSAMCVPIRLEDRVRGVLYLDNRESARSFTRGDLHFANILAHLISLALDKEDLYRRICEENRSLKRMLRSESRLIGVSSAARDLRRKIRRVAAFDTTVLILGESGTGKELVSRAIHDNSSRRKNPFVAVNCAAIPENLLESELFGYAPHSGISGANPKGKPGKFELAHTGTLFLDEIGDMSLTTQAKILRVLEERVVDRLGAQEEIPVDIRVIAATNKDLERDVREGTFREDLYYRLRVLKVYLPPLRERPEDVLPLAAHFARLFQRGSGEVRISPRAQEYLLSYRWAGNIRELRNVIEEAMLMGNARVIYPEDLPAELVQKENRRVFESLAELEAKHLIRVLEGVNWNKRRASEILGINRSTLYEKIKLYGIPRSGLTSDPSRQAPRG